MFKRRSEPPSSIIHDARADGETTTFDFEAESVEALVEHIRQACDRAGLGLTEREGILDQVEVQAREAAAA
ncbi:MAG TPA: hypothetical protein VMB05_04980 [Solirubrobacteraceae bacterium]|nr:hypothetical protein [Solirubrobacteraceae bacterium]